jgi:hypothetical protein
MTVPGRAFGPADEAEVLRRERVAALVVMLSAPVYSGDEFNR